jgi:hypothetical protein
VNNQDYSLPIASTTTFSGIKPDGTTITVDTSTGIASSVGGGNSSEWFLSNQYVVITYGALGETYITLADGWAYTKCTTSNTNTYIVGKVMLEDV